MRTWLRAGAVWVVAGMATAGGVPVGSAAGAPATPASSAGSVGLAQVAGDVSGVHDPTVVRDGDRWYLFSTGDGLPIRRSDDHQQWEVVGEVFADDLPAWAFAEIPALAEQPRLAWAPDISYANGAWQLYWARAVFGTPDAVIGLMTNTTLDPDDPDYRWVDRGMVVRSRPDPRWQEGHGYVAIDPNVVTDESGTRWLAYGSFWDGIALRELDPATGMLRSGAPVHNLARRVPWYGGIEAPYLVHHDGWWWLFASFGYCCQGVGSTYSSHVGRSRSITGPYLDASDRPLLDDGGTTLLGTYGDVVGPGHGSVVQDGEGWMYVHHFYDRSNAGAPTLSIRPILWGPDGWPIAADPGFTPGHPASQQVAGTWHVQGYPQECPARGPDDITISLQPDGSVSPTGTWTLAGDRVEVRGVSFGGEHRDWWWFVDAAGTSGFGRDQRTAAIRAGRAAADAEVGGTTTACGPQPTQPPPARIPPAPATPVPAVPDFTG